MNRLALGTVQFGLPYGIANQTGQVSQEDVKAMLQLATFRGVDILDTAISYGHSESCLGELGTEGFKVVTKLPALPDGCQDVGHWVEQQMADSLARLRVNSVYGLLLHRSQQLLGLNGFSLNQAMQKLKDQGKVQKIGVSIYSPSELEFLTPKFPLDLVQAPFNLLDQRLSQSGWLGRLKDRGIEIHTRSVFLQGLLLISKEKIPTKFLVWHSLWDSWHRWLSCHEISAVEACLAFSLSYPEIDRVVVGVDNLQQLDQIMNLANKQPINDLPNLQIEDENLINPANWDKF